MLVYIVFLSLAVAASCQSNSIAEAVSHLICGDNQCPFADNSTAASLRIDHLNALTICVFEYNTELSLRRCNLTSSRRSYPFCSLKEEGVFCTEIFAPNSIVIPPACVNVSLCTSDCRAALVQRYGCCLNMQLTENVQLEDYPELLRLWELCTFDVSYSCPLAIPELPETIPIVQCLGQSMINEFTSEGICKTNLGYTQDLVNQAVVNTCFESRLRFGLIPYLICELNGMEYCSQLRRHDTTGLDGNIPRYCSTSANCTSECRDSLIQAKERFGCCANSMFYFTSFIERHNYYSCEKNIDIWTHCGVPSPGYCNNTLYLTGRSSFVKSKLYVVIAAILFTVFTYKIEY